MNKERLEQYKEEFENMSYCDLADEFNEPLFSITKSQDNLLKIIYINYANERDKHFELEEKINKAIEYIESKNNGVCIVNGEEKDAYTFLLDFNKSREFVWRLLEILKGGNNE